MESVKSLDDSLKIIAALFHDVQNVHGLVFNTRVRRLTYNYVQRRTRLEGMGFLTKTLRSLGKAFDNALSGKTVLTAHELGFATSPMGKFPRFLGELFSLVFHRDGSILLNPCTTSVATIRGILYLYSKYELPYTDDQEHEVVSSFQKTEAGLFDVCKDLANLRQSVAVYNYTHRRPSSEVSRESIVREARILLNRVFAYFDPKDIHPRHGPGAVATKQQLRDKYCWTNVSDRLTHVYPFDEYFCSSLGHVCDTYDGFGAVGSSEESAKVILVPKDSRGPRLISCEPVDFQWIQQGLGRAIVKLVESHPTTKWSVRFTDQKPNQRGALVGSRNGRYATLDLKEASDRVTTELVRLLFPDHVYTYLDSCRSLSTRLPSGEIISLNKYAPMGSCLCFPVMALCIWALLAAGVDDDARESILVYGDDVIVPTEQSANAIVILESFGLLVNRDKSFTQGFFRESCGTDAFHGVDVTPIKLRSVWTQHRTAEAYESWIAYANQFYDKHYYHVYNQIVERLHRLYGDIPADDMALACPSLRDVADENRPKRRRVNKDLQKIQYHVTTSKVSTAKYQQTGWEDLLRFFTEFCESQTFVQPLNNDHCFGSCDPGSDKSVSQYTKRNTSMLVKRWR